MGLAQHDGHGKGLAVCPQSAELEAAPHGAVPHLGEETGDSGIVAAVRFRRDQSFQGTATQGLRWVAKHLVQ